MAQVLFFGGSIVQGVGDPEGGWADRFKRELHAKSYAVDGIKSHTVFNLGIPGNTAPQVLERIPTEFWGRQEQNAPTIVVLNVGVNDAIAVDSPNNYVSSPQEYLYTMQTVVDYLAGYKAHILLVGLTPVDDTKTRPAGGGVYFLQERIRQFDNAMSELAQSNHLPKVELLQSMLALDWRDMLYADGIHPNQIGHEWIYRRARQPILDMIASAESMAAGGR